MTVVKKFPRRVRQIQTAWIRLKDGTRLAARIWLPADARTDPVPGILEYIPYRRRDATAVSDALTHPYFAGHGYACVRVDMRGSGDSDGIMHDEYTRQEHDDALEVIAWIAAQPWCTGKVGMMGISWGGFNALQVAARRPPALHAIITVASTDDRYADDIHYMGGAVVIDHLVWASTMLAYNGRPPDPKVVGKRWRAMWLDRLAHDEPWLIPWLRHQRRDAQWTHGSVCENYADIECAVYAVGGWADGYSNAIPRLLAGLKAPCKGLIGPWAHAYPHKAKPGPAIGFLKEALRWWDHWLKGAATGIMDEPRYRVWMQESVPPRAQYDERPGRWVSEAGWPSAFIASRRFAFGPGALIEGASAGSNRTEVLASPVATGDGTGEWCPYGFDAEMPIDQRADDGRGLVFDTPPLKARTEILGAPVVTLDLASDKPNALVAVRLNDVAPDGASTRVTYGVLNLTHRDSHASPTPLEPGRRYRVRVQLNDIAHAFPAGHRIRVAVSNAYFPIAFPSPEIASLTLHLGGSGLELPERAPRPEDSRLAPFGPPETSAPLPADELVPASRAREVVRDLAARTTEVRVKRRRGKHYLRDVDITYDAGCDETFRVKDGDPTSASQSSSWFITLEREGWNVRIEADLALTASRTDFHVSGLLQAFEGKSRVFGRAFGKSIPRDLV
jgi:hypothetical protein